MRLLIALLLFPIFAHASWVFVPEYDFFSDDESSQFNTPRLIGSEYQSDKITYLYPSQFHYEWVANQQLFQYSAGSLGPERFLTRGRLKTEFSLLENLEFKFLWIDKGDFESSRNNFVFDFTYKFNPVWSLSLFGQSQSEKRRDSAGLALNIDTSEQSQLRLFYNMVYFSHNKRNRGTDTFDTQPNAAGLVWRQHDTDQVSFKEWSFRYEQKVQQVFPDSGRVYGFQDLALRLLGQEKISDDFAYLEYDFGFRNGFESDTLNTDAGIVRWDRTQFEAMLRYRNASDFIDWWGLKYVQSEWRSEQGNVEHIDVIPHAWIPLGSQSTDPWSLNWRLGYEFTWHQGRGLEMLRSTLDRNNVLEHRANVRLDLWFQNRARLYTLLTFDLDEFGTGETWEGGSMQFSATF